jgi:hypothetical protein
MSEERLRILELVGQGRITVEEGVRLLEALELSSTSGRISKPVGSGRDDVRVCFDLYVTYGHIVVFDPDVERPFNEWRQQHFDQGFSWRPGSVSFRALAAGSTP